MKTIQEYVVNEANVDWRNVHDAVLNVLRKYSMKFGVSKDVVDYCNKIREALDKIK